VDYKKIIGGAAIELDKDYYEQAKQRLINHQRQLTLF